MSTIQKGPYRSAYIVQGSILMAIVTILLAEQDDFVFLSEDDSAILIAEQQQSDNSGLMKQNYKETGFYEREEL